MTGVDLEQDGQNFAQFSRRAIEVVEQLPAVHALHAVKMGGRQPGLVGLQVADEFPGEGRGTLCALVHALLYAVFADRTHAVTGGMGGGGGGMGLGHGQQLDFTGITARPGAGRGDLAADMVGT